MDYTVNQVFQNLARQNERIDAEMCEVLSLVPDYKLEENAGSHFGSILGILNHIIICDINWLKRYRPLAPDSPVLNHPLLDPPGLSWEHNLHADFSGFRTNRTAIDSLIRKWFDEFSPESYGSTFDYVDSRGKTRHAVAGEAFEFFFLHQTHHRGEVSQILDGFGVENNFMDNGIYIEGIF